MDAVNNILVGGLERGKWVVNVLCLPQRVQGPGRVVVCGYAGTPPHGRQVV
ncbi:hypothetical protein HanPI659440_Chr17g0699371 [Helianthus annuus]|nr:hypothetical protein HanPI659440_Chr17g0699371 [Helianthus annuus]